MIQQRSYAWNFTNNENQRERSHFRRWCCLSHPRHRTLRAFPLWPNLYGGAVPIKSQCACDDGLFRTCASETRKEITTVANMWLPPDIMKPRHRTRQPEWVKFFYLSNIVHPVLTDGHPPLCCCTFTCLIHQVWWQVSQRSSDDNARIGNYFTQTPWANICKTE